LADDLSLTRLAEVASLNASYLSRLYKQQTGKGLMEFITEARIAKARTLLLGTTMKIHEISAAVGLFSSTYFARVFKKATSLTPQEYRDQGGVQK
jgi:two-component system response regulator YesN